MFLRSAALGFLLSLALACSSGGSNAPAENGQDAGFTLDPAARSAALDAVAQKFQASIHADGTVDTAAVQAFLASRPEFTGVGLTSDGNVYARFRDGRFLIVFANRQPTPGLAGAAPIDRRSFASTELPHSGQIRIARALGTGFSDISGDLASWAASRGYASVRSDLDLEDMKSWGGDGAIYINTHGGYMPLDGIAVAVLFSGTTHSPAIDQQYAEDLSPSDGGTPRMGYGQAIVSFDAAGNAVVLDQYAVTGAWMEEHMSLAGTSLVLADACFAAGGDLGIVIALHDIGVDVFGGWDGTVFDRDAVRVSRFAFDRMLGANSYLPEDPPQRPFDHASVAKDLAGRGWGKSGNASFSFQPAPGRGTFALLAPSIELMTVDEQKGELTLKGIFGADQAGAQVTVGGTPVSVKSGDADTVVCDLPPGLSGDVVFTVREHQSNALPLTEWTGEIDFEETTDFSDLDVKIQTHVQFRADAHAFREKPATAPIVTTTLFTAEQQVSTASYTASGQFCGPSGCGFLTGAGQVPMVQSNGMVPPPGFADAFFFNGDVDAQDHALDLNYMATVNTGIDLTAQGISLPLPFQVVPALILQQDSTLTWTLPLNDDFSLADGSARRVLPGADGSAFLDLTWHFEVAGAPDPTKGEDDQAP